MTDPTSNAATPRYVQMGGALVQAFDGFGKPAGPWVKAEDYSQLEASLTEVTRERDEALADAMRLRTHALKYIDPLFGSDHMVKDAEDWIENRLARHGESHSALTGIFPNNLRMLANALKSLRLRLFKAEAALTAADTRVAELRAQTLEEAAMVCDILQAQWTSSLGTTTWPFAFEKAAAAIRALSPPAQTQTDEQRDLGN